MNTRTVIGSSVALAVIYFSYLATRLLQLGYEIRIVTPTEFFLGGF
jgi:hypothetical protein